MAFKQKSPSVQGAPSQGSPSPGGSPQGGLPQGGSPQGESQGSFGSDSKAPENAPMELRVLLTNEEASVIIGRKGVNATRIRQETEVYLTILKTETPCPERLMVLKGQQTSLAAAILIIAQLLTEQSVKPSQPDRPFILRILVHKFLAGCIIGPAGAIVREIQSSTQARVSLSVEPLPNSTDKVCNISGTPEAVSQAAARVMTQLAQNPLRPGCSVVPYVVNAYPNYVQNGFPLGGSLYSSAFPSSSMPFGTTGVARGFSANGSTSLTPTFSRTEKMVIPNTCAGAVIGKGGSIIRDIKAQSGTKISLAEASQSGDRIVTITGSLQGIQIATFLIRQRVELQQQQQQLQQQQPAGDKKATEARQSNSD